MPKTPRPGVLLLIVSLVFIFKISVSILVSPMETYRPYPSHGLTFYSSGQLLITEAVPGDCLSLVDTVIGFKVEAFLEFSIFIFLSQLRRDYCSLLGRKLHPIACEPRSNSERTAVSRPRRLN